MSLWHRGEDTDTTFDANGSDTSSNRDYYRWWGKPPYSATNHPMPAPAPEGGEPPSTPPGSPPPPCTPAQAFPWVEALLAATALYAAKQWWPTARRFLSTLALNDLATSIVDTIRARVLDFRGYAKRTFGTTAATLLVFMSVRALFYRLMGTTPGRADTAPTAALRGADSTPAHSSPAPHATLTDDDVALTAAIEASLHTPTVAPAAWNSSRSTNGRAATPWFADDSTMSPRRDEPSPPNHDALRASADPRAASMLRAVEQSAAGGGFAVENPWNTDPGVATPGTELVIIYPTLIAATIQTLTASSTMLEVTIAIAAMTGYENHDAKKDPNTSTLTSPQPFNENMLQSPSKLGQVLRYVESRTGSGTGRCSLVWRWIEENKPTKRLVLDFINEISTANPHALELSTSVWGILTIVLKNTCMDGSKAIQDGLLRRIQQLTLMHSSVAATEYKCTLDLARELSRIMAELQLPQYSPDSTEMAQLFVHAIQPATSTQTNFSFDWVTTLDYSASAAKAGKQPPTFSELLLLLRHLTDPQHRLEQIARGHTGGRGSGTVGAIDNGPYNRPAPPGLIPRKGREVFELQAPVTQAAMWSKPSNAPTNHADVLKQRVKRRCFNCGEVGHLQRDCTAPPSKTTQGADACPTVRKAFAAAIGHTLCQHMRRNPEAKLPSHSEAVVAMVKYANGEGPDVHPLALLQ